MVTAEREGAAASAQCKLAAEKPKLKKKKKNKKNKTKHVLSPEMDAGAVVVDKDVIGESGSNCSNKERVPKNAIGIADAKDEEDPNCPEAKNTDLVVNKNRKWKREKGTKNDSRNSSSLQENSEERNNCSDGEHTRGSAIISTDANDEEYPNCPNANNTDLMEDKNGKKKKKGTKKNSHNSSSLQENSEERNNSGNNCGNEEHTLGYAVVSTNAKDEEDPNCPEAKSAYLLGNESGKKKKKKKGTENNSQNCSSSQENSEERKKLRKRRRRGRKNNHVNSGSLQDSSLHPGADEASLVTAAAEDNAPGCKCKGAKKKRKRGGTCVAPTIHDVGLAEGKGADGDYDIEKIDGVGPPGLSDEKAKRSTSNLGACMRESKKTSCISKGNYKTQPTEHAWKASLPPSPIRGVIEVAPLVVPSECQNSQLDSSKGGTNFSFRIGAKDRLNAYHDVQMQGSSAIGRSECELSRRGSLSCTSTERNKLQEKEVACSSTDHGLNCINISSLAQANNEKVKSIFSPRGSLIRFQRKKLLILDLNGLLADINQEFRSAHMADARVRSKLVFRRPHCDDFLRFCFQNFELGIWSSRKKENVDSVVNVLMRDLKQYLLFCWDMSKCTDTGLKTLENKNKPLVLKELKKLWNKEDPDLPWEQGDYSPSNTLLVDDSPYKALCNPAHTAIFPDAYSYNDQKDNALGLGGNLRVYLERLAAADDVQCYVREHPFGQPFITESHPKWSFYAQICDKWGAP